MTVAELIDWLRTQDQEAEVFVLRRDPPNPYGGDTFSWASVVPDSTTSYVDLRGNSLVPPTSPHFNSRTLYLGEN